jgi:sigma-B regulation protein RsbU (phosphoserine phosphatase)
MQAKVYDELRAALEEKQATLEQWLETTPMEKREFQLGTADELAVESQLETIETALQEIDAGTLGVCEVCHDMVDQSLLRMDYTACVCLDHYSDEERRQLEDELELSQTIQRALLPQQIPAIPGLEIAAFSRPARIVTGDYFDFVQFKDGSPGLVIADVSGHGVSAGLLMTSLQTAFHTLSPDASSPIEVLQRLNHLYIHNINFSTFATVFFAKLDPVRQILYYANAGHPAYFYRASTDEDVFLPRTAPAIGLVESYPTTVAELQLLPGDVLVLYTDGITEAMNSHHLQYGETALADVIRRNRDASAQELVSALLGSLNTYLDGSLLDDDLTLVVAKVVAPIA